MRVDVSLVTHSPIQARVDRNVCVSHMCTKRKTQYSNYEAGLCNEVSNNQQGTGIFIETKKIPLEKIKIPYSTDKNPSFVFHT